MNSIKEVCVESFDEAIRAVKAGASRIELCENLSSGGTTPSFGTIKTCLKKLQVPIFVMIRPRGGNYVYSDIELEIMKEDILICKKLGVKGIVIGILNNYNTIDIKTTTLLTRLASPMEVTFHKAIDETPDLLKSVNDLQLTGISRILTSGGKPTASEGADTLNKMISIAGNVSIIVAGKVTHQNFSQISFQIPSFEYHGRNLIEY